MIELRGMTWQHVRGYGPLVATAQTFMASCPDIQIRWDVRTLQEFADYPINKLTEVYDMVIIDHPFVGFGAQDGCLLPLEEHLDAGFLAEQAANSVGPSHASYEYDGHQWALAVDAAGQVSAHRKDLLAARGEDLPRTWDAVLELARRNLGHVATPLIPVDSFCSFCSLCANAGEEPYRNSATTVSRPVGLHALEMLTALKSFGHPESLEWNPIRLLDRMSASDEILYSPLLFGYSNYARPGFSRHLVHFTNVPTHSGGAPQGAILGGTGLAIARSSQKRAAALNYAVYVASPAIQRTVYFEGGGQPGHGSAWLDEQANQASSGFFRDTYETLSNAYLRPRFNGFIPLQDESGRVIHAYLRNGGDPDAVLDELDHIYQRPRRDV